MCKPVRTVVIWNIVLLITLSACSQTVTQGPPVTRSPQDTTTPRIKSTLPPTWTPTTPPTLAATLPAPPRSTATLTRTPFPTRMPRDTATPTPTGAATATVTTTEQLDGTPTLSETGTLSPTLTATPRPKKLLLGAFDPLRALVLIYGPQATAGIRVKLSHPFTQAGVEKYLLLGEIPGQNCPMCAASIGGAIFERTGNDWEITVEDRHILTLGAFGHAPTGEFIKLGPDTYGVRFNEIYTHTADFGTRLVLITEDEGHLRVALNTPIAAGQFAEGGNIAWRYDSDVDFIAEDQAAYDKIKITTHGTKPIAGEILEFEEITYYTYGRWAYYVSGQQ